MPGCESLRSSGGSYVREIPFGSCPTNRAKGVHPSMVQKRWGTALWRRLYDIRDEVEPLIRWRVGELGELSWPLDLL